MQAIGFSITVTIMLYEKIESLGFLFFVPILLTVYQYKKNRVLVTVLTILLLIVCEKMAALVSFYYLIYST